MLRKLDKLGCRASHTGEIVLEDCRIPHDHLLGGIDRLQQRIARGRESEQGQKPIAPAEEGGPAAAVQRRSSAALGAFERTRPMVAAQAIGIARAALEFARDYAVGREAFGQPIIENQGVAFPLADLAADIDSARLLTWRAAWMAAQRKPFEHAEGSMSKLKASETAVRAASRRSKRWAAGDTSKTSRSRSGTATPSSTPSSKAIWVGWRLERDGRLVVRRTSSDVDDDPAVG